MDNVFETPQPTKEYKERQNKLIQTTIKEMGLLPTETDEGKNEKQKTSGNFLTNLIGFEL